MKDWKKDDKDIYLPPTTPKTVQVPRFKYFTIAGEGNPNGESFTKDIALIYALSYGVKMSPKKGLAPEGYEEYKVYPLEGLWGLTQRGIEEYDGAINKDQLSYKIMIRQPDFVDAKLANTILELVKTKKKDKRLDDVIFEVIDEGLNVQMMHHGSFDSEPASFQQMEQYAKDNGLRRLSKNHKEIYLSDPRKVSEDKLKTILRFKVEEVAR